MAFLEVDKATGAILDKSSNRCIQSDFARFANSIATSFALGSSGFFRIVSEWHCATLIHRPDKARISWGGAFPDKCLTYSYTEKQSLKKCIVRC